MSDDAIKFEYATVVDGILDENTYQDRSRTPLRLMFLLKEANSPKRNLPDLREFLLEYAPGKTWNNVARWTLALGAVKGDQDACKYISPERRKSILRHIAAVNLKKTPGGSTSRYEELLEAAEQNADLIKSQVSECNPDIIICCGVGVSTGLEKAFDGMDLHWEEAEGHRFGKCGNATVLDFWHPASRNNKDKMAKEIVKLYSVAKKGVCHDRQIG